MLIQQPPPYHHFQVLELAITSIQNATRHHKKSVNIMVELLVALERIAQPRLQRQRCRRVEY